jgi:hypothetical protein
MLEPEGSATVPRSDAVTTCAVDVRGVTAAIAIGRRNDMERRELDTEFPAARLKKTEIRCMGV